MPSPQQQINAIDKQINAVRKELRARQKIDTLSAGSWQDAWDKHPELRQQETELFRQRGVAQQARDEQAVKERVKRVRSAKPKKCPTCGCHTLYTRAA